MPSVSSNIAERFWKMVRPFPVRRFFLFFHESFENLTRNLFRHAHGLLKIRHILRFQSLFGFRPIRFFSRDVQWMVLMFHRSGVQSRPPFSEDICTKSLVSICTCIKNYVCSSFTTLLRRGKFCKQEPIQQSVLPDRERRHPATIPGRKRHCYENLSLVFSLLTHLGNVFIIGTHEIGAAFGVSDFYNGSLREITFSFVTQGKEY